MKVLAEVEKIWIIYDLDGNETLDFDEIKSYLEERAFPHLTLSDADLVEIWNKIDMDGNGTINKEEMEVFVHKLLEKEGNLLTFIEPKKPIAFQSRKRYE